MPYRIVTLVYVLRDGKVLLLKRVKPPYVGHWVAPGGKVDRGESPAEGAVRELHEETGLTAKTVQLRALVTETSPADNWQWLIFVYRALDVTGEVVSDEREGELRWFSHGELAAANLPPADRYFMRDAIRTESGLSEYRFDYDETLELIDGKPGSYCGPPAG
jgi:8-oxo-dGTP diphosphatase